MMFGSPGIFFLLHSNEMYVSLYVCTCMYVYPHLIALLHKQDL